MDWEPGSWVSDSRAFSGGRKWAQVEDVGRVLGSGRRLWPAGRNDWASASLFMASPPSARNVPSLSLGSPEKSGCVGYNYISSHTWLL